MATIADLAARLEKLGSKALPSDVAKLAAPDVEAFLRKQADAGVSPSGQAWEPKNDGGRALPKASESISVEGRGSDLFVRVTFPYQFHRTKRPILPKGDEPGINAAIGRALERALKTLGF